MSEEDVHKMVIDTPLNVNAEFRAGDTILRRILTRHSTDV